MNKTLLRHLAQMELVYRTGRSPEKLAELSEIFGEDLYEENPQSIKATFDLHRKTSSRFPSTADILKILPDCRVFIQPSVTKLPQKPANPEFVHMLRAKYQAKWHGASLPENASTGKP